MSTSLERRAAAVEALESVYGGVVADSAESETVDFKEELGTVTPGGLRRSIPARHEPAAAALAVEAACMANSDHGGVLVVGVDDQGAGPAALQGTHLDLEWLRRRIHALTQPSYTVEIEEFPFHGVRLYMVHVPPALEEVRVGTKLRTRMGKACIELTGDRARDFLERRRGYDWSAERSGRRFSEIVPSAMTSAREKYQAARGLAPESDLELCRRLGAIVGDGADPELTKAGAVLLTALDPGVEQLVVLLTEAEGRPSRRSVRGPAPLLALFDKTWSLVTEEAFPARSVVIGSTRRLLRPIPDVALREALVNAIMHRDYRLAQQPITVHAIGDVFKVRSPGGFVAGVNSERLITAPSVSRNPALAHALRSLGLAEREGVGVDTMYAEMLRAGHQAPDITEDAGAVVVTLHGGAVDLHLVDFFESLGRQDPRMDDVRTAMAFTALLERTPLRSETLAEIAQCTQVEALDTLGRLEHAGVVVRLVNRSKAFRLAERMTARFHARLRYPTRRKLEEHGELVRAFLDSSPEIGREDAAALIGVAPNSASRILGQLARDGVLVPVANARGARVRYRLG